MVEMCRKTMGMSGDFLSAPEVVTRSMQASSDFPNLLSNFMGRLLREGFEVAPQTWRSWTRQTIANDFRPQFRVMLSDAALLEPLNENGEFKASSLDEGAEQIQVETFGGVLNVTRRALINDDLNAFSKIPEALANAGMEKISNKVYQVLVENPVMKTDGKTLFHAAHNNLGKPASISITSLQEAREKMRLQKTMKGKPMNLLPKILLTTARNEIPAMQLISQNFLSGVIEGAVNQKVNPFMGAFDLIIEPRLDSLIGPDCWFNIVDPGRLDTVEVCFLNGQDKVYIESQLGFSVDGISLKARLDFGVAPIEWRGMYFNPGQPAKGRD